MNNDDKPRKNISIKFLGSFAPTYNFERSSVKSKLDFHKQIATISWLLLLMLVACLPVIAAEKEDAEPIKIGYIVPQSGQSAGPGTEISKGMQLYMDQINHKMAGRSVKVIIESDDSTPATGLAKVHKLVDTDKVDLLSGLNLSNVLYGLAPAVENYKIPFVVVSAGADDITQRNRRKWFVRIGYTSSLPAHPFGDYVYKVLKYKKVVTLCSDYSYGYEVAGGFQQCFEQAGGQVIQKLWAPLGFSDFRYLIKQIPPDADAIFLCNVGQSGPLIPKQIRDAGIKTPLIGLTASFDESTYPKMGDELIGGVCASLYSAALDTPANHNFVNGYRAKYGEEPSYFSESGYTAMMWIDKAVTARHGDVQDKEKLLAALQKVQLKDAPRGPVKLDAYDSSIDNVYVSRVESKNGKKQNTVIYTYPLVSEFWKYSPAEYLKQPSYTKDYPPCKYCTPKK